MPQPSAPEFSSLQPWRLDDAVERNHARQSPQEYAGRGNSPILRFTTGMPAERLYFVEYYAVQLADHLDAARTIDGPLMMHFGSLDHRVPPDLYTMIHGCLAGKPNACTFWYEGADHGFDRDGYPPYHPEAAALARQRTLDFLGQHLGGNAP